MTPAELLRTKVKIPSDFTSRDWARVQAEVRARAFFMSTVEEAVILDVFQRGSEQLAAGREGPARLREIMREELKALGYRPKPGTEGSIKDLTSAKRMDVVMKTNTSMVHGSLAYDRQLKGEALYPAKRMIRVAPRKMPRNWPERWRKSAEVVPEEGINAGDMSAHVRHPIWRMLNVFGHAHPPYDWGSGMGDEMIRKDHAKELGVATLPLTPQGSTTTPAQTHPDAEVIAPSINDGLAVTVPVNSPAIRRAVVAKLAGAAAWDEVKPGQWRIRYLDPNGSTPITSEQARKVIAAQPLPGAPTYQLDAVRKYLKKGQKLDPGSDALYDLARLVHRIEPTPMSEGQPLHAAVRFASKSQAEDWILGMHKGIPPRPGWPFLAASLRPALAAAHLTGGEGVKVALRIEGATSVRDLRPAIAAITGSVDEVAPGFFFEAGAKFEVLGVQILRDVLQITCREIF